VSSIEPNDSSGELDGGEEVACGFIVAGCDGTILFEPGKEVLDQVAGLVEVFVVSAAFFAIGLGRDDHLLACGQQRGDEPLIGIKRLVSNHDLGRRIGQQHIRAFKVTGLPRRQVNSGRIAQGIHGDMNLGTQPASAASDGLRLFFLAPALC